MGRCRRRSKLFHPILAPRELCSSFFNHLQLVVGNHRQCRLRLPDDCLRRSTRFIPLCHTKSPACPITSDHDHSVAAEAWEEGEVEAGVAGEVVVVEVGDEGGNR
jgi:hypothetical protein